MNASVMLCAMYVMLSRYYDDILLACTRLKSSACEMKSCYVKLNSQASFVITRDVIVVASTTNSFDVLL